MSTQLTDTAHSNGSLKALNGLLTNNKSVQSNDSSHEQNRTVKSKAQAPQSQHNCQQDHISDLSIDNNIVQQYTDC